MVWPLRATTRFPVITQDAVQFSGAVSTGSGMASPACFTGSQVFSLVGSPSVSPRKRAGRKTSRRASWTAPNTAPTPGVTLCTKDHSCWRDFCSPAYADYGCFRATPSSVAIDSVHPSTFFPNHSFSADLSPRNIPRYQWPVTTRIPSPRKCSSARATFPRVTTKILLVGSG